MEHNAEAAFDLVGVTFNVRAAYLDAAAVTLELAADYIYSRRLSRSVHAQKRKQLAFFDLEANVIDSKNIAEMLLQMLDFY